MGRTLSIIIPARDAEREIAKTLEDYVAYFREVYSQDFEILVVPNDCSDNTVSIVEEYCNRYPVIRSQVYEGSIGKGGAVIEGFKLAQGDILSFVDADGATGPAELFKLVQALGEHQAVIGSRWMPGSKVLVKQGFARRVASRGFNLLVRLFFGLPFRDTQCGAKVFAKRAIDEVMGELETAKFAFDVELLYRLKKRGYSITEVPIVWENRPQSTLNLQWVIPEMFFAMLKVRMLDSPLRWMFKKQSIEQ
jgi:glycosyltransferase involved in cell wall biosynthesis